MKRGQADRPRGEGGEKGRAESGTAFGDHRDSLRSPDAEVQTVCRRPQRSSSEDSGSSRIKPLRVNGRTTWTIGIPVHWGFVGLTAGSMANQLTPFVGDANTRCPEFKSFLVNLEKA